MSKLGQLFLSNVFAPAGTDAGSLIPPDLFQELTSLQHLALEGNGLTETPEAALAIANQIVLLSLAGNALTDLPGSTAEVSSSIRSLDLSYNAISNLPTNVFTRFPQIVLLDVRNNLITAIPRGFFRGVPQDFQSLSVFPQNTTRINRDLGNIIIDAVAVDSSIQLKTPPGAPAEIRVETYGSGGHLILAGDITETPARVMTLPRGDTMATYNVVRPAGSTSTAEFRLRYVGAPGPAGVVILGGLVVADSLDAMIFHGQPGQLVTLPSIERPLIGYVDIEASYPGLDTEPMNGLREDMFALDMSHYRSMPSPAVQTGTSHMEYAIQSGDPTILSVASDGSVIGFWGNDSGTAHVEVASQLVTTSGADVVRGAQLIDTIHVRVHETDDLSYNVRMLDLNNTWRHVDNWTARFDSAATLWSTTYKDRPPTVLHPLRSPELRCGGFGLAENYIGGIVQLPIDDHMVLATVTNLGISGAIAAASICAVSTVDRLPVLGSITFDTDPMDDDRYSEDVRRATVMHEIGHTMGFGPLGAWFSRIRLSDNERKIYFSGEAAVAAFDTARNGVPWPGEPDRIVPLEHELIPQGDGSHWSELHLGDEMMTPFAGRKELEPLSPFSKITIRALEDIGYILKDDWDVAADPYTLPYARPAGDMARAVSEESDDVIDLRNDVFPHPIFVVRPDGRVVRVIEPR